MSLSNRDIRIRRSGIGASEARAIHGITPYAESAHGVYLSKVLEEPPPFEETAVMRIGHLLEPIALKLLGERYGLRLRKGSTRKHPTLRVCATPDARAYNDNGKSVATCEAKSVGPQFWGDWGDDGDPEGVPDYVLIQVQQQCFVEKVDQAYVGALLGNDFRSYIVPFMPELATAIVEGNEAWWKRHVDTRTPPPVDGSEHASRMVRRLFPRNLQARMLRADGQAQELARIFFEAQAAEKAAKVSKDTAAQELQLRIGELEGMIGDGWAATWRANWAGPISWKDIAEGLGATPEMIAAHRGEPTRPFLAKKTTDKETRKRR